MNLNDNLITQIKKYTKENYKCRYLDSVPLKTVTNYGLKVNEIAFKRDSSEYAGIAIKALTNILPLLTDLRIINAIQSLNTSVESCIAILNITEYTIKYGVKCVYYVLVKWLKECTTVKSEYYNHFINEAIHINDAILDNFILTFCSNPVNGKFKIYDIGSTPYDCPVVPEEWIGKQYNNAYELHKDMDNLEWRKGKPPVNYCCTYNLNIYQNKYISLNNIDFDYNFAIICDEICELYDKIHIDETIINNYNALRIIKGQQNILCLFNKKSFPKYKKIDKALNNTNNTNNINTKNNTNNTNNTNTNNTNTKNNTNNTNTKNNKNTKNNNYNIEHSCCEYVEQNINEQNEQGTNKYVTNNLPFSKVSYLSSCMQKCIRRGSCNSILLIECIRKMNTLPPYNLPEQQYIRVSSARQIVWRLFISIMEDVTPYEVNINNKNQLCSLFDLACYTLLMHTDNSLQFSNSILNKIINTALHVQNIVHFYDWRKENVCTNNEFKILTNPETSELNNVLNLVLGFMPMMKGDKILLNKYLNCVQQKKVVFNEIKLLPVDNFVKLSDNTKTLETIIESNDMHCSPNLILYVQATLNSIPTKEFTTIKVSNYIWDNVSSYNYRYSINKKKTPVTKIINDCQENMYKRNENIKMLCTSEPINSYQFKNTGNISRLAFLLIFGQELIIHNNIIVTFSDGPKLFKFKKRNSSKYEPLTKYDKYVKILTEEYAKPRQVLLPPLVSSYKWIFDKNSVNIKILYDQKKVSDNDTMCFTFIVNGIETNAFNGMPFITKEQDVPVYDISSFKTSANKTLESIVKKVLYFETNNIFTFNDLLELRSITIVNNPDNIEYTIDWIKYATNIPQKVWQNVYVRLVSSDNVLNVYQVNRSGKKINNACDYEYEGVYIRIFLLFTILYSNTIKIKNNDMLTYYLDKSQPSYAILLDVIEQLQIKNIDNKKVKKYDNAITTSLWSHQKITSESMFSGLTSGKKGYGDAASVGSGKTLTAIATFNMLFNHNIKNSVNNSNGCLILVPNLKLYDTWKDEIKKHTKGLLISEQKSNGTWTQEIQNNTFAITTLGRIRDHPLQNRWCLVIIDECLSVQNSDALQTESAYRQILMSQYGVLMLSATFFRTKFDKLYYMLKMFRSGYPETKMFLSTIINEHIFCHIKGERAWLTNINEFELSNSTRNQYDTIKMSDISNDKKYIKLLQLINKNFDYCASINTVLEKANNESRKCLIYAKSKAEAAIIKKNCLNTSEYPEKNTNVVVSCHLGTYGLNDLTDYDTIITRMNHLDIIIQQKGRLDRPGQKKDTLYLEYIMIKNTIDEAWKIKDELSKNFHNNYIMPLNEFYKLALNY